MFRDETPPAPRLDRSTKEGRREYAAKQIELAIELARRERPNDPCTTPECQEEAMMRWAQGRHARRFDEEVKWRALSGGGWPTLDDVMRTTPAEEKVQKKAA